MRTLIVDLDRIYAATLAQVLSRQECQVDVATTTNEAISFLRGKRFDAILMDVRWLSSRISVILQEIYSDVSRHLDSPRLRLLSGSPPSSLLAEMRSSGALVSVPATRESILSLIRSTDETGGVLVVGAASTEWVNTLLDEGYPAVVVHSLDDAIRHLLHSTHFVFLETGETALGGLHNFVVLRGLEAEPLAWLASTQRDSYIQHVLKPQTTNEITELLKGLQKERSDAELRMSAGRA
jgi:hypothetical protein